MKKLAIVALAALTLSPAAANAVSWDALTCVAYGQNCDRVARPEVTQDQADRFITIFNQIVGTP